MSSATITASGNTTGNNATQIINVAVGTNELQTKLPFAKKAQFDPHVTGSECIQGTRAAILDDIYAWAEAVHGPWLFWLNGFAGTGKTTIARTVARRFHQSRNAQKCGLGAAFFFGGLDHHQTEAFVPTIACQLADRIPSVKTFIAGVLQADTNFLENSTQHQWQQLVVQPLAQIDDVHRPQRYLLIIDALDECDPAFAEDVIGLIHALRELKGLTVRVLLASRSADHIRYALHGLLDIDRNNGAYTEIELHKLSPQVVNNDIRTFYIERFKNMGRMWHATAPWPTSGNLELLVHAAHGLFIWAATACLFIEKGRKPFCDANLDLVLHKAASGTRASQSSSSSDRATRHPEAILDELYITVLRSATRDFPEHQVSKLYAAMADVIGAIIVLSTPLSPAALNNLLGLPAIGLNVAGTLQELRSIVDFREDSAEPIQLHHPSFSEFVCSPSRCGELPITVDNIEAHRRMLTRCLDLMQTSLQKNMCRVDSPGALVRDLSETSVTLHIPAELQYACQHWIYHLQKSHSAAPIELEDRVNQFLRDHFLHWLEGMSWTRCLTLSAHAMEELETLLSVSTLKDVQEAVRDMKRFLRDEFKTIEEAPLQVYFGALVFTPTKSWVRRNFEASLEVHEWMEHTPTSLHSSDLRVLHGHDDQVNLVRFSPDGKLLASASRDRTIRIWDVVTGLCIQTVGDGKGTSDCLLFSDDSTILASAERNRGIRLWYVADGLIARYIDHDLAQIHAMAFVGSVYKLACATAEERIRMFCAGPGQALITLDGHREAVLCLAFSAQAELLASGSADTSIMLWDRETDTLVDILQGHDKSVTGLTFSADGQLLASASDDQTVKIWRINRNGFGISSQAPAHRVDAMSFLRNPEMLAVESKYRIRIWKLFAGTTQHVRYKLDTMPRPWHFRVAMSTKRNILAVGVDSQIDLWTLWSENTDPAIYDPAREGDLESMQFLQFSPDSDTAVSVTDGDCVTFWNTSDEEFGTKITSLRVARGKYFDREEKPSAWRFSRDSELFALSLPALQKIIIWDLVECSQIWALENIVASKLDFSPDGRILAAVVSSIPGKPQKIATFNLNTRTKTLINTSADVSTMKFAQNGSSLEFGDRRLPLPDFIPLLARINTTVASPVEVIGSWIYHNGKMIVSLSSQYNHVLHAVRGTKVAFGDKFGNVHFMKFAGQPVFRLSTRPKRQVTFQDTLPSKRRRGPG